MAAVYGILIVLGVPVALAVVYFLFLTLCILPIRRREYSRDSRFYRALLVRSTSFALWLGRVRVLVSGMERIPSGGRFLLVCNHRSKFDPLVTWYALRRYPLAFISKASNFRVPWYGRIIRRCCFLAIDRENPRSALETIRKAAALIQDDQASVAVYPEGTRSLDGALLPFHCGVFKIAQRAGVPVVVTAIRGTEQLHRNFCRCRSVVRLDVVDVIPAETVRASRTAALGQRARDGIEAICREGAAEGL